MLEIIKIYYYLRLNSIREIIIFFQVFNKYKNRVEELVKLLLLLLIP